MNEIEITLRLPGAEGINREFVGHIATAESTHIGSNDHGGMTGWVHVKWGGGGVGLGGLSLDEPDKRAGKDQSGGSYPRKGTELGMEWIRRMIWAIAGSYGQWESIPGSRMILLFEKATSYSPVGVADLSGERVFIFKDLSEEYFPQPKAPSENTFPGTLVDE